ncbi:MAG: hypothetical protein KIS78_34470 [Labilithrix sp.]|nr:hypothetical protein [Labilithrix sp.]
MNDRDDDLFCIPEAPVSAVAGDDAGRVERRRHRRKQRLARKRRERASRWAHLRHGR